MQKLLPRAVRLFLDGFVKYKWRPKAPPTGVCEKAHEKAFYEEEFIYKLSKCSSLLVYQQKFKKKIIWYKVKKCEYNLK